ncbi:MAG TPA: glycoside hydrolase family 38 C-terminal domain-containing protein [Thermoanaerobaculia bacterium]|nr:glycoside hydrolase family 38 C-terminal domain-containing protein [Thermoanaerobaculia bacterium]
MRAFAAAYLAVLSFAVVAEEPTLYVVGYAHLDTEWRWEYPQTIREFLPNTLHDNFALFEKYPHYVFNFSGANRYRMMKEYYPADYARLQEYVKAGRWFPSGSSMEEGDVNSPSAESIVRQILYGSRYFQRDFGKTSAEYMLPDSFGFPASLPSILAHMNIRGFSTQKLDWGSAVGKPFNVGVWIGPDGQSVIAALNPGSYSADIREDLTSSAQWLARVRGNAVPVDYHYYGTGDVGGAPREASVARVESMVTKPSGSLRVLSSTAEQMFLDLTPEQIAKLPRYTGELELTQHSAGSLTSQAYQKQWNRANELLADAAEKASVAAMLAGGRAYPQQRLENAWTLVMGGQFHDIAAGTATPLAHQYAWNDDVLAMNQFQTVLTGAVESMAAQLDTRATGTPVVVYNALDVAREDVVEVPASFDSARVFGPDGKEVPAQVSNGKVLFLARVPSAGFAVYDVRSGAKQSSSLTISESSLENARYRIAIDANGDVASIFDKSLQKELLSAPLRLALQTETPQDWPAWNMDWDDRQQPPRAYVSGPASVRIVERGPARVALEVTRETEGSTFVQTIRLASGDAGNRIEIANAIDWKTPSASLKATFPLAASNALATYNWGVGTIQRGNNDPKKYEVASHEWIDLTDASGAHGVTLLTAAKFGSDKPDDRTLRLTLLYTPGFGDGNGRSYSDQTSQDWGHHEFVYGLASHEGTRIADVQARRLEQPLLAFVATKHAGALGKSFSLLRASSDPVHVMALKKAEDSDEVIVRLVEVEGRAVPEVRLTFAKPVLSAREVNGREELVNAANVKNGELVTSFAPFQLRTFAVRLATRATSSRGQALALNTDTPFAGLPTAMLPSTIAFGPIDFRVTPNAMLARGQTLALPQGTRRAYMLAAADGDQNATFRIGDDKVEAAIQNWTGFIGQWDTRRWERREDLLPPRPDAPPHAPQRKSTADAFAGLTPAFLKPAPVAWFASHHLDEKGEKVPYAYSYLFAHTFDVAPNATTLTLPDNDRIRIMAVTTSSESPSLIEPRAKRASITIERGFTFKTIPPPSRDDAATNATVTILGGTIDPNSGPLRVLTDGALPTNEDEPGANVFFRANSWGGRLRLDLGRPIDIAEIRTYSRHPDTRGPQVYKVYGSNTDSAPPSRVDPETAGWTLIAFVDTRPVSGDAGGPYAVRIASTGTYRYLLFDVFETESDDAWGNTFYSEVDVMAR